MIKICKYCKGEFDTAKNKQIFCKKDCFYKNRKSEKISRECLNCQKDFSVNFPSSKKKFCGHKCSVIYNGKKGKVGGDTSSLGKLIEKYGEKKGKEKYKEKSVKLSKKLKGKEHPWAKKPHTKEHKEKIRNSYINSDYYKKLKKYKKSFEELRGPDAKENLSKKMRGTFSREWFIKKYGDKIGGKKYKERCENIKNKSYFKKYNKINKNNFSKISQELFWTIYNLKKELIGKKVYFAELNHEYGCETSSNFDFVIKDSKKIIEFHGDIFHANPKIYSCDDKPNPYYKKLTAKKIWDMDKEKQNKAKNNGYEVLVIWESDYIGEKDKCVKKCLNFLDI